ncbi:hypothetical protein [Aliikangiella sp. IMCC44359]|uniref:hypothetical protein n=1 Tax=Aliikangiella sp. IMCC44359 TaxID=3459125 RepID=UPI00403AB4AF
MFGPLFYSQKNPKGPNLKHLENLTFDLSGNQLSFSVPYGNWSQLPDPQGKVYLKTNLYDTNQFERFDADNWYTNRLIFERHFSYGSFNHPRLGGGVYLFNWIS